MSSFLNKFSFVFNESNKIFYKWRRLRIKWLDYIFVQKDLYSAKITKKKKIEQELVVSWYWLTKYLVQACFPVLQTHSLASPSLRIFRTRLSLTVFLHRRSHYQSHCFFGQRFLYARNDTAQPFWLNSMTSRKHRQAAKYIPKRRRPCTIFGLLWTRIS